MRIRELLLCSIDPTAPIGPEQDVVQQPMQSPRPATAPQMASNNEPPPGGVTPANDANLAQKIQRINTLHDMNNAPEAPGSGNFYQRLLGRPNIPLK